MNHQIVNVLIDTGAQVNAIPRDCISLNSISPTSTGINAWGTFPVTVLGTTEINVCYKSVSTQQMRTRPTILLKHLWLRIQYLLFLLPLVVRLMIYQHVFREVDFVNLLIAMVLYRTNNTVICFIEC